VDSNEVGLTTGMLLVGFLVSLLWLYMFTLASLRVFRRITPSSKRLFVSHAVVALIVLLLSWMDERGNDTAMDEIVGGSVAVIVAVVVIGFINARRLRRAEAKVTTV
jgi:amino acid permease